jgi:hypothetical protein
MWVMIEYGLRVSITEKTRNWVRALFGMEPFDKMKGKSGAKTQHASTNEANNDERSDDEKHPEKVTNLPIDQSKQEQGCNKYKARYRKLFRKRGASKHDEETGTGKGK